MKLVWLAAVALFWLATLVVSVSVSVLGLVLVLVLVVLRSGVLGRVRVGLRALRLGVGLGRWSLLRWEVVVSWRG